MESFIKCIPSKAKGSTLRFRSYELQLSPINGNKGVFKKISLKNLCALYLIRILAAELIFKNSVRL